MHCIVQFRTLIFIITYVGCNVEVSCNNDSPKAETNIPNFGKLSTNINTSNISLALSKVHSNLNSTKPVFSEGGSIVPEISEKIYDASTSRTSIQNETLNEKSIPYDIQNGFSDSSSTDQKPHVGRKGVAMKESSSEVEHSIDETAKATESGDKSSNEGNVSTPTSSTTIISTGNFTTNLTVINGTKGTSTSSQENSNRGTSGVIMTSNSTAPFGSRKEIHNSTTENKLNVTELTQPPKSKPEFTRDDSDIDDNSSYSLTNPEGDYVIPVVATIFAAPLLIVLGMFLYKRSKEFWERRHYRRMDFLIDGMYND